MSHSITSDLLAYWPGPGPLLPNHTDVRWTAEDSASAKLLLSFLSESVRTLDITLTETCDAGACRSVLQVFPYKSPNVRKLDLAFGHDAEQVEAALGDCISKLKSLRTVRLPRFFGTSAIVAGLSGLEDLEAVLQVQQDALDPDNDIFRLGWSFPAGAFGRLRQIELDATLDEAEALLHAAHPTLNSITLHVLEYPSNERLQDLNAFVAEYVPVLVSISLDLSFTGDTAKEPIPFQAIAPLLRCKGIESLDVCHPRAFIVAAKEVLEMGKAWPGLPRLYFGGGTETDTLRMPITILDVFAMSFPSLEELGIPVKAAKQDSRLPPASSRFLKLQLLDPNTSGIEDEDITVATIFLAFILPPDAEISPSLWTWQHPPRDRALSMQHKRRWKLVAEGLKAFYQRSGDDRIHLR